VAHRAVRQSTVKVCSTGWYLCPHSVWVWSFGFTQTYVSGLLFLGARGHHGCKSGGHLEL